MRKDGIGRNFPKSRDYHGSPYQALRVSVFTAPLLTVWKINLLFLEKREREIEIQKRGFRIEKEDVQINGMSER